MEHIANHRELKTVATRVKKSNVMAELMHYRRVIEEWETDYNPYVRIDWDNLDKRKNIDQLLNYGTASANLLYAVIGGAF